MSESIFGRLPAGLFRLFTGASARFFAALLEHLDAEVFGVLREVVPKRAVIEAVGEFIAREAQDLAFEQDDEDRDLTPEEARDNDPRRYHAYNRLLATGWLIEHRDRYRRIVDLDPEARLLLQALLEIKSGRLRSYGGEVLQVQALLASVRQDPAQKAENVHNAARSAAGFLNHLRAVSGGLRKIEEVLLAETNLADLFGTYFTEFVAEHLIADYARLHTRDNPFRFRMQILNEAQDMAGDALLVGELADAALREGRARDREAAEAAVLQDLQAVIRVFEAIDDHLELVYATQSRIERRIRNTVRYMDRIAEARSGRIAEAMARLGETALPLAAPVSVPGRLLPLALPLQEEHLYQAARKRGEAERRALRTAAKDPAVAAYEIALRAYEARARLTPERIVDFVERALDAGDEVRAGEIRIDTLDDFFVFERLRDLPYRGEAAFRSRYQIVRLPGRLANDWIDCPDFAIRRRPAEAAP